MINDGKDMQFLGACFCTRPSEIPCEWEMGYHCRFDCPFGRFVPGWEEIQEIVRDDDRRQQKEEE